MGWVGIKDQEKTDIAQKVADTYLSAYGRPDVRVRTRVENTTMLSGLIAHGMPAATSLPNQSEWRDEFGSRIIFFENINRAFMEKQIPILRKVYDGASEYTDDEINQVAHKLVVAHEAFHPVTRYDNDQERLGSQYTYVNELLPDLLARKVSADLVGSLISQKELKIALPLIVSKALTRLADGAKLDDPYMEGWATALNYMIENQAATIEDGKLKLGTDDKLAESFANLTNIFEEIAKHGQESEVLEIKQKYADTSMFAKFN